MLGRIATVVVAAVVSIAIAGAPVHAVDVNDDGRVWIYGDKYTQTTDGCVAKGINQVLQAKVDGRWVTVAKGKEIRNQQCVADGSYPYKTRYRFTVDWLGSPVPGEGYTLAEMRQTWFFDGKKRAKYFTKQIFPSAKAHKEALLQGFLDSLGS